MYRIIGSDLKEYGPASAEQLIQWIAQGRVDAQTHALAEGSTEWKPLSQYPEFAAALAAKAAASAPPPPGSIPSPISVPPRPYIAFDSKAMADRILARGVLIDPIRCVSRSWDLLMRHFWLLVGATFVITLVDGAVSQLLHGVLYGGLFLLFLKLIRGQRAEFGDAFAGFTNDFLALFLVGLVSTLLIWAGLLFCILPGIYLAVAWMFAIPLVADKKLEFWPAMEVSLRVVHQNWFTFFLLAVLNILVVLLGFLALCVGIYVALPVLVGAVAYAYEDLFSAEAPAPARSF